MASIRCPKCGGGTRIRTARDDNRQFYVCLRYPKCKGRFAADEVVVSAHRDRPAPPRTQRRREMPRPESSARDDARGQPERRAAIEHSWGDDWGDDWGADAPARRQEAPRPQPRREQATTRRRDRGPRGLDAGIERMDVKGGYEIDEVWGDEEITAGTAELEPVRRRRRPAPRPETTTEENEPRKPRLNIFHRREHLQEPLPQRAREPVSYRPQYRRGPKPAPVMPRESEEPRAAPYRPQYERPSTWDIAAANESYGQQTPESGAASYRPQYRRGPKPVSLPREPERLSAPPYSPQYEKPSTWDMDAGAYDFQGPPEEGASSYRPQYRRGPRPAPVGPQDGGQMRSAPYRPQYPRADRRGTSYEAREPSKLKRHRAPEEPGPQKPSKFLPLYKKTPKKFVPPEQQELYEPQYQPAPQAAYPAPRAREAARRRQQRVPQEFLAPTRKKRNMPVIIIALIIAFLAIDGMIYAAFVLR